MGNDRFNETSYRSYSDTHKLQSKSRDEVFTSRNINEALNPAKVNLRESCDSESNPNSTPISLFLDVTGSMGFVAETIAKDLLPDIMGNIYEQAPVSDPHIMFGAIGDRLDQAPLQVSQYEAGAEQMIEQLRTLWLEGNGHGNRSEGYNYAWYFCAHKTKIDCFDKHGRKGYIFTMGDEGIPPSLSKADIYKVFHNNDMPVPTSNNELLAEVQKRFRVFHLIIEQGSYGRTFQADWTELLGPNAIFVDDIKYLPLIISSTLLVSEGTDINAVIAAAETPDAKRALTYAFTNALAAQGVAQAAE